MNPGRRILPLLSQAHWQVTLCRLTTFSDFHSVISLGEEQDEMTILRRFDDQRISRPYACVDSEPERNTLFKNLNDAPV
jgi:hypothetical protein